MPDLTTAGGAASAVLNLLDTPLMKDVDRAYAGSALAQIKGGIYDNLSSGERALVDLAEALWCERMPGFSTVDRPTSYLLLCVLAHRYLGGEPRPMTLEDWGRFNAWA